MTLFFNWEKLVKEAKGDPLKVVELLKAFHTGCIMKYAQRQKLVGNSFLLNPDPILNNKTDDILYVYQYLNLAALRDYGFYKLYGLRSLQLSFYPDIKLGSITHNPLLNVTNQEIHFKYEGN